MLENCLIVKAPAKLNLHLEVFDRRSDGFHNIESIFLALNFHDILHFEPVKDKKNTKIAIKGLDPGIPIEKNIVFHALNLFREMTGWDENLSITLEKHIPAGGGLGGGSSDAAATLLALNELAGFPLNSASLLETAAALGSDVPFFIHQCAAALVSGRGDIIEPFEAPRLFFVLVNPGFHSDTAAAYRLLDNNRKMPDHSLVSGQVDELNPNVAAQNNAAMINKSKAFFRMPTVRGLTTVLRGSPAQWQFKNDFLPVFGEREKSIYKKIIDELRSLGAGFAGLSGSGSTCFGVFIESGLAERGAAVLREKWNFVEYCELCDRKTKMDLSGSPSL